MIKKYLLIIIYSLLLIVFVLIIKFRLFDGDIYTVMGDSMLPNLKNGQIGYTLKLKDSSILKRGDIITFLSDDKEILIKRIIALPNETISCVNGYIMIDGDILKEEYLSNIKTNDFSECKLMNDEYFVLGDNREKSIDSRILGPIKISQITGYNFSLLLY